MSKLRDFVTGRGPVVARRGVTETVGLLQRRPAPRPQARRKVEQVRGNIHQWVMDGRAQ